LLHVPFGFELLITDNVGELNTSFDLQCLLIFFLGTLLSLTNFLENVVEMMFKIVSMMCSVKSPVMSSINGVVTKVRSNGTPRDVLRLVPVGCRGMLILIHQGWV